MPVWKQDWAEMANGKGAGEKRRKRRDSKRGIWNWLFHTNSGSLGAIHEGPSNADISNLCFLLVGPPFRVPRRCRNRNVVGADFRGHQRIGWGCLWYFQLRRGRNVWINFGLEQRC